MSFTVITNDAPEIPANTLPSAPLLEYVEALGGVSNAPGIGGVPVMVEIETAPYWKEAIDRDASETRKYHSARQALRRAGKDGHLTLRAADAFCCEVLQVHPVEVYGATYFEVDDEPEVLEDAA